MANVCVHTFVYWTNFVSSKVRSGNFKYLYTNMDVEVRNSIHGTSFILLCEQKFDNYLKTKRVFTKRKRRWWMVSLNRNRGRYSVTHVSRFGKRTFRMF
ncbi:hypothetical protein Avbf_15242 [Armadillidium vulgare]|nr:hypothetical protein Avbf_15242 [Armadillidium vulgare]